MDLKNPKTILVIQIGKIGDMILTTPLFPGLKELFPGAKLTVLASHVNKDIPLNNPFVDEIIVYEKNFLKDLSSVASLRGKTDLLIDIKEDHSTTSALLVKAIKPSMSLGFNYSKKTYDISLNEYSGGKHATDIAIAPLNYLSSTPLPQAKPYFEIPPDADEKMLKVFPGKTDLLINISAGTVSRYIDKDIWLKTINHISSKVLTPITITGLARDAETIEYLVKNSDTKINYIKTDNILEVAALVSRSKSVVTPDTSIVHICSVFNVPVAGLYPDVQWNLDKFRPLSDIHEIVVSKDKDSLKGIDETEIAGGYFRLLSKMEKNI